MRIIRFQDAQGHTLLGTPVREQGGMTIVHRIDGDLYGRYTVSTDEVAVTRLLSPVVPTSILCIGLNYRRHAQEVNAPLPQRPVLFMKTPGTLADPGQPIEIPVAMASHKVDYECELAVVIGKSCKNATRENALDFVAGYTCANDVSARDWQIEWGGGQWCRGKSFDTFTPLGPALVTPDEIPDPQQLGIRTILNGRTMQDWRTDDMVFDVRDIIVFLSGSNTLIPGTVILTGTPHGVGMGLNPPVWLKDGDSVSIEIDRIGRLTNPVALERR